MKKLIAILLTLVMVLSLAACGEKKGGEEKTETKAPAAEQPTQGEQSGKEDDPTTPEQPGDTNENATLETNLWTLTYDANVWTYDEEDDFYDDETYSKIYLCIMDDEDSYITSASIRVSIEDQEDFRESLVSNGFDAYEYAVNNAYDLVNVGGEDCLMAEGDYWGEGYVKYLSRNEAASATIWIEISGDCESAEVAALLDGLTIHVEDIGNEDAPWPWDGEPFSASDSSQTAGDYTVSSQWLPITDCIITAETFNHAVAVSGDKAYIVGEGTVRQYAYDGASLVFEEELPISGEYTYIQATADGNVWASGFMEPLTTVSGDTYEGADYVTMHPSGAWGISWFSGSECQKFTISGSSIDSSEITFAEVSTISSLIVDEDYIYVCGYAADDSGHKVFVYDADGALQMVLCDETGDSLGSITFMAQVDGGFLGMDGNMRDVILWAADGTYIDSIADSDLFGTNYPWFCGGTLLDDGSILVIMTEDRADESAMELVAFKLTVS